MKPPLSSTSDGRCSSRLRSIGLPLTVNTVIPFDFAAGLRGRGDGRSRFSEYSNFRVGAWHTYTRAALIDSGILSSASRNCELAQQMLRMSAFRSAVMYAPNHLSRSD
jgi:hypothetical protein